MEEPWIGLQPSFGLMILSNDALALKEGKVDPKRSKKYRASTNQDQWL
jgi:hypothetical protein